MKRNSNGQGNGQVSKRPLKRQKRFINRNPPEYKWFDSTSIVDTTIQIINPDFIISDRSNVVLGTGPSNRVGRRIYVHGFEWRFLATYAIGPTTTGSSSLRFVIVQDKQANGASAGALDIFNTDDYASFTNKDNGKRFKILVDKVLEGLSIQGPQNVAEHGYIRFKKPLEIQYSTGVTIPNTNNIMICVAQEGQIGTANPRSSLTSRLCFTDG